ncbi:toxin-antitoxin system YwqK family antitoxin [Tenacibaculum sp. SG-28]|uniref:toxin-antitoxin system YwqK family antitoxin n=1 Tax=Tenacibaculum sp. SG-28 TaxID=754426 RepID=UPI000CF4E685|nr:nicotinic acid mononucleotide adenyltransferase [Tenacibaculum sp. SG-28]PQJ21223.1 nicotinic acid mononucleotide adenyltransferase [Tenacibaculum sp. SG-28]
MRKIAVLACMIVAFTMQAQVEPTYERENDKVKVTYYYEDGAIKEQGFFKDKKLDGTWITYDQKGNKTAIAHYASGNKVGKWFIWSPNGLKEIDYNNNTIASVQTWKEETKIAVK